jgi:HD-like signal output (HDOD) protein/CheY-like chemotaxis protein
LRKAQPRVLVVDDEPMVLRSVLRLLGRMQPNWEVVKAASAAEAMGILEGGSFDAVIADLQMPGMNGAELLRRVQKYYPQVVRIVLSGSDSAELVFRSVPTAHQFLNKPFETKDFVAALDRALELRKLLCHPRLPALIGGSNKLPSPPRVFSRLSALLANPDVEAAHVAELVGQDVALSSHLLQLASSGLFGTRNGAVSVQAAVAYVGFDTVRACILSAELFRDFPVASQLHGFSLEALQRRSVIASRLACVIAPQALKESAMVAGMLHEIGYLILASRSPDLFEQTRRLAQTEGMDVVDTEHEICGASHAEIGAYLLALWGLPVHIVESVLRHHSPLLALEHQLSLPWCVNLASRWAHDPEWLLERPPTTEERSALGRVGLEDDVLADLSARARDFQSGAREEFISQGVGVRAG